MHASILSFSIGLLVFLRISEEDRLPSGIREVELFDGVSNEVIINSTTYHFILPYFNPYYNSYTLKVQMSSGHQIRRIYLDKGTEFYDFWVILKEARLNSIIIWIEKEGD